MAFFTISLGFMLSTAFTALDAVDTTLFSAALATLATTAGACATTALATVGAAFAIAFAASLGGGCSSRRCLSCLARICRPALRQVGLFEAFDAVHGVILGSKKVWLSGASPRRVVCQESTRRAKIRSAHELRDGVLGTGRGQPREVGHVQEQQGRSSTRTDCP